MRESVICFPDMDTDLKETRKDLFTQLDSISTPIDLASFQRNLTNSIMGAEELKAKADDKIKKSTYGLHNRMCRSYGDAMVWELIDSHAIRQMKVHNIPPPHLSGMKEVVEGYLDVIQQTAEIGALAIIPDLTNIVQVGDVILIDNPEEPTILEIKGDQVFMTLPKNPELIEKYETETSKKVNGRLSRQLEKISDITKYLRTDELSKDGHKAPLKAISVDSEFEHYWEKIDKVVKEALKHNDHTYKVADGNLIWATASEPEDLNFPEEITEVFNSDSIIRIGNQLAALEETSPYIKTPFNWKASEEVRFALMEGDIVLTNIVDISKLVGMSFENATIVNVGVSDSEFGDDMIYVEVEDELIKISPILIHRMVHGFQTLESVGRYIMQSALEAYEIVTK